MLDLSNYKENTFEELYYNAITQIPLYTKEWTNYSPSDPGVTMLENMSAFNVLQQSSIYKISEPLRRSLLELAGIKRQEGKSARVLLYANDIKEPVTIPANQKFFVGDVCFENNHDLQLTNRRITDVFLQVEDKIIPKNEVLKSYLPYPIALFGEQPEAGMKLYMLMNELPDAQEEIKISVTSGQDDLRNPVDPNYKIPFAEIKWQLYTEEGYVTLKAKDSSNCFMRSGLIRLTMPKKKPALYEHYGYHGYAIRAVLQKADYDLPPQIHQLHGFLFEVWQKETKAMSYTFPGSNRIDVTSLLMEEGYYRVFVKEDDSKTYRLYEEWDQEATGGRYYELEKQPEHKFSFRFSASKFGHVPSSAVNAVKIIAYNESMMRQYHLGTVLGYDNQEIELPEQNILADSFCVIVKKTLPDGTDGYEFIKPGNTGNHELQYIIDSAAGIMQILDAGDYINAEMYLCNLAVTQGEIGNIDAGKQFRLDGNSQIQIYNACKGIGGRSLETIEEQTERFVKEYQESRVAVTEADYEALVLQIPGLCIQKAKAILLPAKNTVQVVVVPRAEQEQTKLSPLYKDTILHYLNQYRLLTTKVVVADADYARVDVNALIYFKSHYTNGREIVTELLKKELNYITSGTKFGTPLRIETLYRKLEQLECVDSVEELNLSTPDFPYASKREMDIIPQESCLLIPGNIQIETQTRVW